MLRCTGARHHMRSAAPAARQPYHGNPARATRVFAPRLGYTEPSLPSARGVPPVTPFVRLRIALCLVLAAGIIGTMGFMAIERWSFIDSFYMTVITLATIGYGEVRPLDTAGRIFDIGLIVFGVTSGAYAF